MKNSIELKPAIQVPEALTLLTALKTNLHDRLTVAITVATHALDQFEIRGKVHPSAPMQTLYSSSGSFSAPTGRLLDVSGDLTTQAVGDGSFTLDVGGYHQINLYAASVHAAGSLVNVYSSLR